MQDVTDAAFQRTLARIGSLPDMLMTPYFRSTTTTCAMAEPNLRCIRENDTGVPLWAQLAGSEAAALVRDARLLDTDEVAGINLNAGCPSPLVNRHGAGAGLLRTLPLFREILLALREALPSGRFSVKCRLGWADADEFPALLEILEEARPDSVMVHARTRKELYGGTPHRERWTEAVQRLSCPVWINGDLNTEAEARLALAQSGAAGVMLGRGAVRNPYLFRQLRGGSAPTVQEMETYYAVLLEETGRVLTRYHAKGHCNRMKKYLSFCYADMMPEQEYALRRCTAPAEMAALLRFHGADGIGRADC